MYSSSVASRIPLSRPTRYRLHSRGWISERSIKGKKEWELIRNCNKIRGLYPSRFCDKPVPKSTINNCVITVAAAYTHWFWPYQDEPQWFWSQLSTEKVTNSQEFRIQRQTNWSLSNRTSYREKHFNWCLKVNTSTFLQGHRSCD